MISFIEFGVDGRGILIIADGRAGMRLGGADRLQLFEGDRRLFYMEVCQLEYDVLRFRPSTVYMFIVIYSRRTKSNTQRSLYKDQL